MTERFQRFFTTLGQLSAEALDRSALKLVVAEKRHAAKLIAHLAEMSRSKTALELGYRSLFDYCVRRLRLSEGSVAMRIQIANRAVQFPQLLAALAENRLSLTAAALLAPHLTDENVDELSSACEGRSKREVEEHLVSLRPKPVFQNSIRRQPSPSPRTDDRSASSSTAPAASPPTSKSKPEPKPPPKSSPIVEPARPETFNFRFSADRRFKEKLERLAEVLGVENVQGRMAEVLEQALDLALDKKDPKRKLARRTARDRENDERRARPRPDEVRHRGADAAPATSRYVSSAVRERVLARAEYRCEYRARDGTRCRSRTGLQIDHERPFAVFRSHDERYLRALCPAHNRLTAEHVYGSAFVHRKIAERGGANGRASPEPRPP